MSSADPSFPNDNVAPPDDDIGDSIVASHTKFSIAFALAGLEYHNVRDKLELLGRSLAPDYFGGIEHVSREGNACYQRLFEAVLEQCACFASMYVHNFATLPFVDYRFDREQFRDGIEGRFIDSPSIPASIVLQTEFFVNAMALEDPSYNEFAELLKLYRILADKEAALDENDTTFAAVVNSEISNSNYYEHFAAAFNGEISISNYYERYVNDEYYFRVLYTHMFLYSIMHIDYHYPGHLSFMDPNYGSDGDDDDMMGHSYMFEHMEDEDDMDDDDMDDDDMDDDTSSVQASVSPREHVQFPWSPEVEKSGQQHVRAFMKMYNKYLKRKKQFPSLLYRNDKGFTNFIMNQQKEYHLKASIQTRPQDFCMDCMITPTSPTFPEYTILALSSPAKELIPALKESSLAEIESDSLELLKARINRHDFAKYYRSDGHCYNNCCLKLSSEALKDRQVLQMLLRKLPESLYARTLDDDVFKDKDVFAAALQAPAKNYIADHRTFLRKFSSTLRTDVNLLLEHAPRYWHFHFIMDIVPESLRNHGYFCQELVKRITALVESLKKDNDETKKQPRTFTEFMNRKNTTDSDHDPPSTIPGNALSRLSERLQDSPAVVRVYVTQKGRNLQYASDRIRKNMAFVRIACTTYPEAICYAMGPTRIWLRDRSNFMTKLLDRVLKDHNNNEKDENNNRGSNSSRLSTAMRLGRIYNACSLKLKHDSCVMQRACITKEFKDFCEKNSERVKNILDDSWFWEGAIAIHGPMVWDNVPDKCKNLDLAVHALQHIKTWTDHDVFLRMKKLFPKLDVSNDRVIMVKIAKHFTPEESLHYWRSSSFTEDREIIMILSTRCKNFWQTLCDMSSPLAEEDEVIRACLALSSSLSLPMLKKLLLNVSLLEEALDKQPEAVEIALPLQRVTEDGTDIWEGVGVEAIKLILSSGVPPQYMHGWDGTDERCSRDVDLMSIFIDCYYGVLRFEEISTVIHHKSIVLKAVAKYPAFYDRLEPSFKEDFDVLTTVLAVDSASVSNICLAIGDEEMWLFAVQLRERLSNYDKFTQVFLYGFIERQQLEQPAKKRKRKKKACMIPILNQGLETTLVYKKRIAEYLGMPTTAGEIQLMRQCSANIEKWGY